MTGAGAGRRRWVVRAVAVVVTVGLLVAVGVALVARWDEVRAAGGLPGVWPVAVAAGAHVVGNLLLVAGWRRTVRLGGVELSPGTAVWLWSSSTLSRYVVAFGQLGGRAVATRQHGHSATIGAVTAVIEVGYVLATTALLVLVTVPAWAGTDALPGWVAVTAAVPAVGLWLLTLHPGAVVGAVRWLADRRRVPAPVRDRLAPLHEVTLTRRTTARLLVVYVANLAARIVAFVVLADAVAAGSAPLAATVGAYAAGTFAGLVAVFAPAGLGVREGATALVLAPAIGAGPALLTAATARLAEIVAELVTLAGGRLAHRREVRG